MKEKRRDINRKRHLWKGRVPVALGAVLVCVSVLAPAHILSAKAEESGDALTVTGSSEAEQEDATASEDTESSVTYDDVAPTGSVTAADTPNQYGYYHGDVTLNVTVSDSENEYSGIAGVKYAVSADGTEPDDDSWVPLYTWEEGEKFYNSLSSVGEDAMLEQITVDSSIYNTADVTVYLYVTDLAGNAYRTMASLKISTVEPTVSVSVSGDAADNALEGFYNACRTAMVTIVDRDDTFDAEAATQAISVQALDADGYDTISTEGMISDWMTDEEDNSIHTATITFSSDAHYRWSIEYMNKAGLSCACGYGITGNNVAGGSTDDETAYAFTVDTQASRVTLTPSAPAADNADSEVYGNYNSDVTVSVSVSEGSSGGAYSGIRSVSYYITCDGEITQEETTLYSSDTTIYGSDASEITALTGSMDESRVVDASANNSSNVVVTVTVVDNAGNSTTESVTLDIDVTAPTITISYDSNTARNGCYFNSARTATVVITERDGHFDAKKATASITISATDYAGADVENRYTISEWTLTKGDTPDEDTHTATVTFKGDANYTFEISYTDEAANTSGTPDTGSSEVPYMFTVDTTAPTGTLTAVSAEGMTQSWETLMDSMTFGFFSSQEITVSSTQTDATSPIESVKYYRTNSSKIMKESELAALSEWKTFTGLSAGANQQFVVYLQITDMAGNVAYLCTGGLIVDNTAPVETISPQQSANDIYSGDVTVSVKVTDPTVGDTYSGLKEVRYEVRNMGTVTQSGTLYSFSNDSPSISDLKQTWTGSFLVEAERNNSNDVQIIVYVEDNAGNSSQNSVAIKIDVTAPVIYISYDNNSADSTSYYRETRTATIMVTERNFDADAVTVSITNTDGTIPSVLGWTTVSGSGNGDGTTHTATITYSADGDYTFDIGCTDLAGNACVLILYADGTTNPTAFTIDQTLPTITVTYDNNAAANGTCFRASRTATVTITEHNFDVSRVVFTQTASLDGSSIAVPEVLWSHSGNVHTATITYNADGDYTFEVEMTDLAGNENSTVNYGNSVAANAFTVDLTMEKPLITGVENGMSYRDDVIPGVAFSDRNFASYEITLLRTRRDELNVDVTDQFITEITTDGYGGAALFDTFERIQENDGIYTLTATMRDLAGNEETESVIFTVNRFGSVYAFNQALVDLQDAYVQSVDEKLMITEYNPDRLVEGSLLIEVTKDGTPVADTVYEVSPVINEYVGVGTSGWYQYAYTIDASNFAEDGIYRIVVSSEDEAGNFPETTNYDECEVLFRVDTTAPEITAITGLEKSIVNAQSVDVRFEVFDSIGLKSVTVYLDGSQYQTWTGEEIEAATTYSSVFSIAAANSAQEVRFVVVDLAGNVLDTDERDADGNYVFQSGSDFNRTITISTNLFVRWFANKPLFWGTVTAAAAAAALLILLIQRRRKQKETQTA